MKNYAGKNPIYQKWDEASFTLDALHMTGPGRLIYRALLQMAWYISTRPDLPNDPTYLQRRLGISAEFWDANSPEVLAMFQADPETGLLFHPRLRRDWAELSIYREKQAAWGKKGGKPLQNQQAIGYPKGTLRVALGYPIATLRVPIPRIEENINQKQGTQDDDAALSASPSSDDESVGLRLPPTGGTLPVGESKPTSKADLTQDSVVLTAFVNQATGYAPPSSQAVLNLLKRFPVRKIQWAFKEFMKGKTEKQLLGAVRTFFQGETCAGIILRREQDCWKESLECISKDYDGTDVTVDEYLADNPMPVGIDDSYRLIQAAYQRQNPVIKKWKAENLRNVEEVKP